MVNRVVVVNNPLVVKNNNYTWKNIDGAVWLNISGEINMDVEKLTVIKFTLWWFTHRSDVRNNIFQFFIAVAVPNQSSKTYDNILLKQSVDVCKISQGFVGNIVTKVLMEHFNSSADFPMQCPFKKRVYTLTNYKLNGLNAGWLANDIEFFLTIKAVGKVKTVKSSVTISTVRVYGTYKTKK